MKFPFTGAFGWLLIPSHRSNQIDSSVPIDIAMPHAMACSLWGKGAGLPFLVVVRIRTRRDVADSVLGPIRPGVPRIAAENVQLPVAIEIGHTDRLEWRAVVDRMMLP